MRHDSAGSAGRVYLTGPLTFLDPLSYAPLEDVLLDLGLIVERAAGAFAAAARELRDAGFAVSSRWELAVAPAADGHGGRSAARVANARTLRDAELIAVLDGWCDVPGAVDEAVLAARVSSRPCLTVSQLLLHHAPSVARAG